MNENVLISVVVPVYYGEMSIDELVSRLLISLSPLTNEFEILLIDDCGPDRSWDKIIEYSQKDKRIRGVKLSRNFGQHHAITAGLDLCQGEWVVVMDCDLQDRPEEIPNLYRKALEGFDIVFARRINRKDKFIKRFTSELFYKIFSYLSGIKQDGTIANFGIYSKKVIQAINDMREPMRAFSPMARWVGFNKTSINVEHNQRVYGESSYNWSRLISLALDIAIAYSDKPLKLTIKIGLGISFLSVCYTIYNLIAYELGIIKLSGYASIIISIWFLSGLIIFTLGIIGLYLSKIFEGIKNRPIYIVDKKINF